MSEVTDKQLAFIDKLVGEKLAAEHAANILPFYGRGGGQSVGHRFVVLSRAEASDLIDRLKTGGLDFKYSILDASEVALLIVEHIGAEYEDIVDYYAKDGVRAMSVWRTVQSLAHEAVEAYRRRYRQIWRLGLI